jgi:hypothetical protein
VVPVVVFLGSIAFHVLAVICLQGGALRRSYSYSHGAIIDSPSTLSQVGLLYVSISFIWLILRTFA